MNQQYEHKVIRVYIDSMSGVDNQAVMLNGLDDKGWEFITAVSPRENFVIFYLRKPKEGMSR
jgi:hypothetical protein